MRILIADKFEQFGIEQLEQLADAVACEPELKDDSLSRRLQELDPTILIVRSTKVPGQVQDAGKGLKLIIRAGAGFDTIDTVGARERGISVANCPGMNSVAVAELVMGHMIALDRRIPDNVADLRAHKWDKKGYSQARGLKGRTLGLIGVGRIGTEVARRALAFEMKVLFFDVLPDVQPVDHPNCRRAGLDDVLRQADFVSLHVPGGDKTHHLINAAKLALMQPHARLINTSRASVVDEAALVAALREGRIGGAALDVYASEPAADGKVFESATADAPNLYGTHHIGASTEQAQLAVAEETVRIVAEYKASGKVLNCVNA
ncbi:MAG: hydroxyacid dehydrogenase [Planctomycetes bacterium]|nr:hydroxyacid dehydrogenase [Planctomycetota bacterium]